ncbi:AI-2E family transporter [Pseudonocardia sulfidoxydans]|uniref:AI-2E family transporter n=1 Tax=Pseudonocardia sulfidoxydans TaxID=54011 RepID=UPI0011BECDF0|nr:AI-2E family transporter [Pseudonocardia sulfidoxydans]
MTIPQTGAGAPAGDPAVSNARRAIPRALVVLLGAASVVVVVAGAQAVAWLIGPAFMALIIVIAVAPVQGWLRRKGWPGWATTLVVILLVYGLLLVLAFGLILSVAQLATELPQYSAKADGMVNGLVGELARFGVGPDQLAAARGSLDLGKLAGVVGAILGSVAGLASNLVFLLALLLFLSVESGGAGVRLASIGRDRPQVSAALTHFAWGTRQYLLVTTVFGLIVALLDWAALAIMGIPLALTWGLLSFVTNYIPNVGFIIGVIPPALLALLTGGWSLAIAVVVVYCVLNFIVQSIIQPRFIGDAVGLSVTVTFVALVFWAWLLGPLGAILAIPLTLLCKALLVDIDPQARWAAVLLRDTPMEPEEAAAAKAARKAARRSRRHGHAEGNGAAPGTSEDVPSTPPEDVPDTPSGDGKPRLPSS